MSVRRKWRRWIRTIDRAAKKLEAFGFGMLVVEGGKVFEVMKPNEREPQSGTVKELLAAMLPALRVRST